MNKQAGRRLFRRC